MQHSLEQAVGQTVKYFGSSGGENVRAIKPSMDFAKENPRLIGTLFYNYYQTIKHMFSLPAEHLAVINRVNRELQNYNGLGAFLSMVKPQEQEILTAIRSIGNLTEPNMRGLDQLSAMMNNAQSIKDKEPDWTPKDGDARANSVIWGQTKGATAPMTDVHLTICHGIERMLTQQIKPPQEMPFTKDKDWFIHPLTDVVLLNGILGKSPEKELFTVWSTPRPDGLGWISQRKITAYQNALFPKTGIPSTNSIR